MFAAGAQIQPIELEEALEAFRNESDLDRISDRTRIARGAIEQLNVSTAYAAHILMIADQSPGSLAEAVKERRQPAFVAAAESFAAAWHAAEGNVLGRESGVSTSREDANIAAESFGNDLDILTAVARIEEGENSLDWLGLPANAEDAGPFGPLWARGIAPSWYSSAGPEFTIRSGEDIATDFRRARGADVICWHVSPMDKVRLEGVKTTMAAVAEDSNSSGLPPPAFIVYAQELDDPATGELISRGAAVFRDRIAGRIPANTGELLEATALIMNGENARRQRNNFWQSRPRQLLQAAVTQVVRQTRTWDPDQEVVGSADEYRSIVDLSKPLRERLNRERGWPIDI